MRSWFSCALLLVAIWNNYRRAEIFPIFGHRVVMLPADFGKQARDSESWSVGLLIQSSHERIQDRIVEGLITFYNPQIWMRRGKMRSPINPISSSFWHIGIQRPYDF
jgi:hypothetical protein